MNLFVQYRSYLCQLAIFAAFALLATTVAAQTYTVTDLGALGRNSRGSYSNGQCINANGQVAGESSAASNLRSDPAFCTATAGLPILARSAANMATGAELTLPVRSPVIPLSLVALIAPFFTAAGK